MLGKWPATFLSSTHILYTDPLVNMVCATRFWKIMPPTFWHLLVLRVSWGYCYNCTPSTLDLSPPKKKQEASEFTEDKIKLLRKKNQQVFPTACRLMIPMINHARPRWPAWQVLNPGNRPRERDIWHWRRRHRQAMDFWSFVCILQLQNGTWEASECQLTILFWVCWFSKGAKLQTSIQLVMSQTVTSGFLHVCHVNQALFPYLQNRMIILQLAHGVVDIIDPGWKDKGPEIFENTGWNIN